MAPNTEIAYLANANPRLVMDGRSLIPVAKNPGVERGRDLLIEEPSFEGQVGLGL